MKPDILLIFLVQEVTVVVQMLLIVYISFKIIEKLNTISGQLISAASFNALNHLDSDQSSVTAFPNPEHFLSVAPALVFDEASYETTQSVQASKAKKARLQKPTQEANYTT